MHAVTGPSRRGSYEEKPRGVPHANWLIFDWSPTTNQGPSSSMCMHVTELPSCAKGPPCPHALLGLHVHTCPHAQTRRLNMSREAMQGIVTHHLCEQASRGAARRPMTTVAAGFLPRFSLLSVEWQLRSVPDGERRSQEKEKT